MSITFDKRLAELDAYLQMLISENESIDQKISEISSSTTNANREAENEGLLNIKNNLETLLGSIKHSILLLQIAKVSIKTSTSSAESESPPSSSNTTPPPIRPVRTKSPSSTPNSKEKFLKRLSKNQVLRTGDFNPKLTSLKNFSANQSQTQLHQQEKQQQLSYSSPDSQTLATGVSTGTVSSGKDAPHRSEFNTELTAPGVVQVESSTPGSVSEAILATATAATAGVTNLGKTLAPGDSSSREGIELDSVEVLDEEDDDDAFFDAADEQHNRSVSISQAASSTLTSRSSNNNHDNFVENILDDRRATSPLVNEKELLSNIESVQRIDDMPPNKETNNNLNTIQTDESIDWDALYEDEDEEDLGSLESQGSVIKHLLSQIRIGMDLTKVVLPTFILERRSLLEMYADFFAHPDLFSAIPDQETAEERMVQLVKWYLSAFHAGRKSAVAKKPYNPILGEIFKCEWQLDGQKADNNKWDARTNVNDSDDTQKLTFIAEQVSHHPPVSAFYAENKEKSISCSAHIYTKSKYLGLSVGVNNIGTGVINLLNHKESYICTFPSAYGRSILTVPWVELGGSVNIVCNETGYKANIEFVTKPFYGGKKHRVIGEILRPSNERFLTIDGEWNGIMYSKSSPNSNDKQIFVDTTSLPVIKKRVKPVTMQESHESRNVWKEVTRALKLQDINTATSAKSFIEQRQRDLLKDRLENGVKWKTRYFEASDDGWVFSKPLSLAPTDGPSSNLSNEDP